MAPGAGSKFYLSNGRLDLSILNEDVKMIPQEDRVMEITDQELMDLQESNPATALQEMALMFEVEEALEEDQIEEQEGLKDLKDLPVQIEDEFIKVFNDERLQEEMQEFGIKR